MKLVLYYFSIPFWRAEVTRISLFINNIDFDDYRISDKEYEKFKINGELPNQIVAPFKQLPVLVVDEKVIAQTGAIARFCGKISGMYPRNNDLNAAKIDQIIEAAQDINYIISLSGRNKNKDKKIEARKKLADIHLPRWLQYLENLLIENNESNWFVGNTMTIADIAIWRLLGWIKSGIIDGVPTNILEPYSNLLKMRDEVYKHPKVKEWMSKKYGKEI
tara:strand:+ start:114 stop:770 length:657 start_codon:yes stop_codon:yes gene_type:complete